MKTPMLIKPSLEEIRAAFKAEGMPENEADKFWGFYESNGWRVGRNRMVSLAGAIAGWKARWRERTGQVASPSGNGALTGIDKVIRMKELERVQARMKFIRNSYSENQNWSMEDRRLFATCKARENELKKILGVLL